MSRRNGVLAGILLVLFAMLVIWRILSPPGQKQGLYRCLPENSVGAVSVADPLSSLDRYLKNPGIAELCTVLWGFDSVALAENKAVRGLAGWLCGDRLAAAWVPAADPRGWHSWSATTAPAGWRSALVRFLLWIRYVPGLGRLQGGEDGICSVRLPDDDSGRLVLSLGMLDGVLMVTYAADSRHLLDMRQRLLFGDRPPAVFAQDRPWEKTAPNSLSVWMQAREMPQASGVRLDIQAERDGALNLLGRVRGPALPEWNNNRSAGIAELSGRIPLEGTAALLAVSGDILAGVEDFEVALPGADSGEAPDWVVLNLSVNPYAGRLMGIAVPAVSVRWRRKHPLGIGEIDRWIDGLNRQTRLGLIRRGIEEVAGRREMLLDSSLLGGGLLGRDDSSALLAWGEDGTVELSTSAASSRRQAAAGTDARIEGLGRWLNESAAASGMLAGGWISGGQAAEALRNFHAVYRLLAMFHVVEEADVRPGVISVAADVLDALDPFGPVRWSARAASPGELTVRIVLNPSGLPVRP